MIVSTAQAKHSEHAEGRDTLPNAHSLSAPSLARQIGTATLALAIINTIVGSGIYALPAAAAALMGPAAVMGYVGCSILVGFVALCFAECGSRLPETGGTYAWSRAAFGPAVGASVGYLMAFANYMGSNAAVGALLLASLRLALPQWPTIPVALVLLWNGFIAITNIRGVAAGARVSAIVVVVKLVPLLVLVAVGLTAISSANLTWPAPPSASSLGQVMVLLFFAFMGAEGPLSASGEVRNASRTIPRALVLGVLVTGALYCMVQIVAQGVLGDRLAQATDAPLAEAAGVIFGPAGRTFLLWAAVLSTAGYLTADILSGPRMLFALARDGLLPRFLGRVHPAFRTPWIAIAVYASIVTTLALTGTFRQLAVFAAAGTLAIYLISALGVLRLRRLQVSQRENPFVVPGGPVIPLIAALIIVSQLATLTTLELLTTSGLAAAGVIVGAFRARSVKSAS
jgi:amino acid transporter